MEAMLLKIPEVATRLGMSRAKVYELMAGGAPLGAGRRVPARAHRRLDCVRRGPR